MGLVASANGLDVYLDTEGRGSLAHVGADGQLQTLADGLAPDLVADVARAADGTLYVTEAFPGRVTAIAPDGKRKIVAGSEGPAGSRGLLDPGHLLVAPDGGLLVADPYLGQIARLGPDGSWKVLAGSDAAQQTGSDLANLALNAPTAATFDSQGRLVIAEHGGLALKRFDGKAITTLAHYDPREAPQLQIGAPSGLVAVGDDILFIDNGEGKLRRLKPDGRSWTWPAVASSARASWRASRSRTRSATSRATTSRWTPTAGPAGPTWGRRSTACAMMG